jgi:SAM-dependent methyltransferase
MDLSSVNQLFGNVDIYLLDQILKKKFQKGMTVLDAGCGEGRNLLYFINTGFSVYGVDLDPTAVRAIQFITASSRPDLSRDNFQQGDISNLSFADHRFDLIIASAVLHFAKNENHFSNMFRELVRCLKPGGMLFIRMASNIGIEDKVKPTGPGRYMIPDGTERFLLTREILNQLEHTYPLRYLEPFKTVNVNDQRVMSTLIITST